MINPIGRVMRGIRRDVGMTQMDVENAGGPAYTTISRVEGGLAPNVSIPLFIRWCRAMDADPIAVFAVIERNFSPETKE